MLATFTYLNIRGHICKCNHYVLEVGNKSHVCSRGGHKGSPYGPPWAQFRKIFHCIPEDICRCIRLFHPCTYHHSAQRIQIGYRQDTYFITCNVRLRKFKQYIGCFQCTNQSGRYATFNVKSRPLYGYYVITLST